MASASGYVYRREHGAPSVRCRAMSIKYALLGLMRDEPMHGYRVKEAFDRRVGSLWGLTRPQIYQTLNALERVGLLTSHGERVGSRPARRIYTLTDLGRRAFERWLDSGSVCRPRPFRADLLLRLLFVRERDVAPIAAALERAEQRALQLVDRIARVPNSSARDGAIDVGGMLRAGAAQQAETDLDLVRSCRREFARWSGATKRRLDSAPDGEPPRACAAARRFGVRSTLASTASPPRRRSAGAQ